MQGNRRSFLKTTGIAATAVLGTHLTPNLVLAEASGAAAGGGATEHKLPPLPYAHDALEPYIDAKTVELHHDKHHAAYVKGLNEAEAALAAARAANDYKLAKHWSKQFAFHGAGNFLHSLYWITMAPAGKGGGGAPTGPLAEQIAKDFGGFDKFQAEFSAMAKDVEASGWCALHYRAADKRLVVLQIENHQKLTSWNVSPLLVCDVWEHAYYLKYNNKRDEYIKAWWNVVNWPQAAALFDAEGKQGA
jgi:Fe-Mn family superoxide dismutase